MRIGEAAGGGEGEERGRVGLEWGGTGGGRRGEGGGGRQRWREKERIITMSSASHEVATPHSCSTHTTAHHTPWAYIQVFCSQRLDNHHTSMGLLPTTHSRGWASTAAPGYYSKVRIHCSYTHTHMLYICSTRHMCSGWPLDNWRWQEVDECLQPLFQSAGVYHISLLCQLQNECPLDIVESDNRSKRTTTRWTNSWSML